jgi:hypothetical protein
MTRTVEVRLLQLPVKLWGRSQEQHDALMREFALMQLATHEGEAERHVPARLIELIQRLNQQYAGTTTEQEDQLYAALDGGVDALDLTYVVPEGVDAASRELGGMLDEADEYCRQGRHLLTLAADEELIRFRWWYLDQFINQPAGRPPVAWPDYQRTD